MKRLFTLFAIALAFVASSCNILDNISTEIDKTDDDKTLPDYCDINTIEGWTNTRFCKNGMVVFTDNFEGTDDVRKSLMFIPLENGEMVSMYAGYDENGFPQYLSFDDIVILIDNHTDTSFNATVFKDNQVLWTATDLPLDNFQLDDENHTRAWHENNWARNTAAIAGVVTSSIEVGVGIALCSTGVGAVAGVANIAFAGVALYQNLNILFGPGESYATNKYIEESLQEIGQEALVEVLSMDKECYLAQILNDSEWFDIEYKHKLPNLFWADLALELVDNVWGKTVTESQRMLAYALAQRSYQVITGVAGDVTEHTAELSGFVTPEAITPLNKYAEVDYGIVVYKADDPSMRLSKSDIIGNGGPFTLLFRGLDINTTYYYFVYYYDKTNSCFRQGETKIFYTGDSDLREQLIQFYHSTGGDNWTYNYNWCSDRPLDEWYGIDISDDNQGYYINLNVNNLTGYGSLHSSEIVELECRRNQLTSLDVSGCTALEWLLCYGNQLTSLDVSGCTALEELDCGYNQLTSLDVSGCTALKELDCDCNQLTSLDLSGLTTLDYFDCSKNQLTSLDVSGCTALGSLTYANGQLTSLNVSGCTALEVLFCDDNQLTSLDVSGCTALEELDCGYNQLTSLDVSGCTALKELDCDCNQLTSLDVSGCTALETLNCPYNQLTSLDVSSCIALDGLSCYDNQLTSLDVSSCTALQGLDCENNQLTSLNVSGCTALMWLDCYCNQLTSLDVSGCTALKWLGCYGNKISQVIPEAFDKLDRFNYDQRYTDYYRDKDGVLHYTDHGVGWWYPGEPQKGYHGR